MIDPQIWHITPTNDLCSHVEICNDMPFGPPRCDCACKPEVTELENGNILVVHNSFDGREGVEWAREILSEDV